MSRIILLKKFVPICGSKRGTKILAQGAKPPRKKNAKVAKSEASLFARFAILMLKKTCTKNKKMTDSSTKKNSPPREKEHEAN